MSEFPYTEPISEYIQGYQIGFEDGKLDGAREFAEWLPQHFDLRFSNNPSVWLDEFFNHTTDRILAEWQKEVNNAE